MSRFWLCDSRVADGRMVGLGCGLPDDVHVQGKDSMDFFFLFGRQV